MKNPAVNLIENMNIRAKIIANGIEINIITHVLDSEASLC